MLPRLAGSRTAPSLLSSSSSDGLQKRCFQTKLAGRVESGPFHASLSGFVSFPSPPPHTLPPLLHSLNRGPAGKSRLGPNPCHGLAWEFQQLFQMAFLLLGSLLTKWCDKSRTGVQQGWVVLGIDLLLFFLSGSRLMGTGVEEKSKYSSTRNTWT